MIRLKTPRLVGVSTLAVLVLVLAGCSSSKPAATASASAVSYGDCQVTGTPGSISLTPVTAGTLTVAAVLPQPGLFVGDTPESIKGGFEYCIAAEIANRAGLPTVTVINVPFDGLIAGTTKPYDLAMSGIFITDERKKTVDFTTPYEVQNLGVMVKKGSTITKETLKDAVIGVYQGSIAEKWVTDTLKSSKQYKSFPTADALNAALAAGQVGATVYDLPTDLQAAQASNGGLQVIAQVKIGGDIGAVLLKGSKEKAALDTAIEELKSSGQIDKLFTKWLVPLIGGDPSTIPIWTY